MPEVIIGILANALVSEAEAINCFAVGNDFDGLIYLGMMDNAYYWLREKGYM